MRGIDGRDDIGGTGRVALQRDRTVREQHRQVGPKAARNLELEVSSAGLDGTSMMMTSPFHQLEVRRYGGWGQPLAYGPEQPGLRISLSQVKERPVRELLQQVANRFSDCDDGHGLLRIRELEWRSRTSD
jgi:hypothetical protein